MARAFAKQLLSSACIAIAALAIGGRAGADTTLGPKIKEPEVPEGVDVFSLDLAGMRKYSAASGFEVVGHSYFKIDQRTPFAKGQGRPGPEIGSGFNTVRVYDGIAYLAGYAGPPTLFGVLIADVRDPNNMQPLSFVPCNPGTRCAYLRVIPERKLLVFGNDTNKDNPAQPAAGAKPEAGWSFYDVADPRNPKRVGFVPATPGGRTHGMENDDRYIYGCGTFSPDMTREGLQIIDAADPAGPKQVATWHVQGQIKGEQFGPLDRNNPDGKPQIIQCHEIVYHADRLYLAWRDSGLLVLDVKDRTKPKLLAQYDYVPPFHGGALGAAHTSKPIVTRPGEHPDIVVHTDEIFDCPQGFGRIVDVSDLKNPEVARGERSANLQLLSTFRIPDVQDKFDQAKREFACPKGPAGTEMIQNTTHLPWSDHRSPSLLYVTWYDEGLRALDISNPFAPRFIGHYLSPHWVVTGKSFDRHTREVFQDATTSLLYVTDGNGGGLTVLRYTGPIPGTAPLPGAR